MMSHLGERVEERVGRLGEQPHLDGAESKRSRGSGRENENENANEGESEKQLPDADEEAARRI